MEYVYAYLAGLLTLINPCVLPILPVVLATSVQAGRHGPLAVAAGLGVSFVVLGLAVNAVGLALGVTPELIADIGAVIMIAFGAVLLVPQFSERFATATAGISARADAGIDTLDGSSMSGQFLTGVLLGAVWVPCIGPTLGTAIGLASQGESLGRAGAIMAFFAIGVGSVIVALGYGARSVIQQRQAWLRAVATRAKPILGIVFIVVGLGLLFRVHHMLEFWALQILPQWLTDFSVRF